MNRTGTGDLQSFKVNDKVGSHDPISVQLSLESLLCMIENVGFHTVQFSQPVIS